MKGVLRNTGHGIYLAHTKGPASLVRSAVDQLANTIEDETA